MAPQLLIFGVTREESNSILLLRNDTMVNSIQTVIINETDGWEHAAHRAVQLLPCFTSAN